MTKFDATMQWLKEFLGRHGFVDVADQIDKDWCWKDLGRFAREEVPKEAVELVVRELIASGDGEACFEYCRDVADREDVRAVAEQVAAK